MRTAAAPAEIISPPTLQTKDDGRVVFHSYEPENPEDPTPSDSYSHSQLPLPKAKHIRRPFFGRTEYTYLQSQQIANSAQLTL